jgi:MFS family permease
VAGGRTFRSLATRNYRLYFEAALLSNLGTWMQRTAQAWLVLHLPGGDSTDLGGVLGLQFLPILLFGPFAGVLIDRLDKRSLLQVTQGSAGLLAAALGVLDLCGVVHVWHVYLLALGLGMVTAVDGPARQSFVIAIVGPADVANAIALNSTIMNVARLAGPAIGGYGIEWLGTGWMFVANGASYGAMILALARMDRAALRRADRVVRRRGQFREGLAYVRSDRRVLLVILVAGTVLTFGQNFQLTIPLMATEVFHRGPGEFGLLTSMAAVGSVTGALLAAGRAAPRMRYVLVGAAAFGGCEIRAGLMPSYLSCGLLLVAVGVCQQTFTTSANATVQLSAPDSVRGRVMALYMTLAKGGTAFGAPAVGALAAVWGARWGLLSGGIVSLGAGVIAAAVLLRARPERRAGELQTG